MISMFTFSPCENSSDKQINTLYHQCKQLVEISNSCYRGGSRVKESGCSPGNRKGDQFGRGSSLIWPRKDTT